MVSFHTNRVLTKTACNLMYIFKKCSGERARNGEGAEEGDRAREGLEMVLQPLSYYLLRHSKSIAKVKMIGFTKEDR